MVKDYSNYKNLYLIEFNGTKYEVVGNSNESALRCLSRNLCRKLTPDIVNNIKVIGSVNSPNKLVYKVDGFIVNKLNEVNYL